MKNTDFINISNVYREYKTYLKTHLIIGIQYSDSSLLIWKKKLRYSQPISLLNKILHTKMVCRHILGGKKNSMLLPDFTM